MPTDVARTRGTIGPDKAATVMSAAAIQGIPGQPLGAVQGTEHRVLWSDGKAMAGVLTVQAEHELGAHTHRENQHHFWVLSGQAEVLGETVGAGSYVHVPPGVEHNVDATGTDGCTVFYLYLPPGA